MNEFELEDDEKTSTDLEDQADADAEGVEEATDEGATPDGPELAAARVALKAAEDEYKAARERQAFDERVKAFRELPEGQRETFLSQVFRSEDD